jgi:hypothetical protein
MRLFLIIVSNRFRYAEALKPAFTGGGIAGLKGIENRGMCASNTYLAIANYHFSFLSGWFPSDKANVFVVSFCALMQCLILLLTFPFS